MARPNSANSATQRDNATQPDNTAVNARDTDRATRNPKLPIDQKENQTDIDLTAKIRQQVLKADGMSVNARNCKIITADGPRHAAGARQFGCRARHDRKNRPRNGRREQCR